MTKKIIIFDIDGTLADCQHRQIYVQGKKKDWKKFFSSADDDQPIEGVVCILKTFWNEGTYEIVLCTGRPESMRPRTLKWLERYQIEYHNLMMRKEGDFRQDSLVKEEMLEEIGTKRVLFVIDDRKQVVDMWRKQGLLCLQCAEGDF